MFKPSFVYYILAPNTLQQFNNLKTIYLLLSSMRNFLNTINYFEIIWIETKFIEIILQKFFFKFISEI